MPGFVLNPAVGLAALLLTLGTAIAGRSVEALRGRRGFPIYAAAAFAVIGAVITRGILVPRMMRIRDPAVSVLELQQIFVSGSQWWVANDIVHVLAFAFNLWALLVICSVAAPADRETDA